MSGKWGAPRLRAAHPSPPAALCLSQVPAGAPDPRGGGWGGFPSLCPWLLRRLWAKRDPPGCAGVGGGRNLHPPWFPGGGVMSPPGCRSTKPVWGAGGGVFFRLKWSLVERGSGGGRGAEPAWQAAAPRAGEGHLCGRGASGRGGTSGNPPLPSGRRWVWM